VYIAGALASWRTRRRRRRRRRRWWWLPTRRNGRGERHVGTKFVGDDDVMVSRV
jgi:hypothetical protein